MTPSSELARRAARASHVPRAATGAVAAATERIAGLIRRVETGASHASSGGLRKGYGFDRRGGFAPGCWGRAPLGEALGGYYVAEASDMDSAVALAARIPAARMGGAIEVRPVVER